jgi:RimJ/RimL family protein N-acetyltransferase
LVPLEREKHFDNAVEWLNDPEVTEWTLVGDLPVTRVNEEEWFLRALKPSDELVEFAVELRETGEHIGFTELHAINRTHGSAASGTLLGRRDLWGQGYGSESIALRSRYAFEVLGLRMILSEILDGNTASLRALKSNGYHEYGRVPQRYWKRGEYRDGIYMVLFAEEWVAQNGGLVD